MTFSLNKRTFTLAVAAGALLAAAGAHAQTALDDILKAKVLKVAVQTDSAPYGFVGTDLKPIGLDVDMANYIGKKLGVPVELVVVVSASLDLDPSLRLFGDPDNRPLIATSRRADPQR